MVFTGPIERRPSVVVRLVDRDPALRVISYPVLLSSVIVFNSSRPPFDDVRIRRAVDAIVDRERLVKIALAGFGSPADGAKSPKRRLKSRLSTRT